jgi:hypothetical protein
LAGFFTNLVDKGLHNFARNAAAISRTMQSHLGLNLTTKQTRKQEFLAHMEYVVPWAALVELVALYAPEGKKERPPFAVQTMTAHPTEKASAGHQHRESAVVTMAVLDLEVSAGVRP